MAHKDSLARVRLRWLILGAIDVSAIVLSAIGAFLLRFNLVLPEKMWPHMVCAVLVWSLLKPAAFLAYRAQRSSWRAISIPDIIRIGLANLTSSIASAAVI